MRKTLITEIIIQSPVAEVWRILTDFAGYPRWNPFMTHISGSLQTGARLHVRIQPVGGKAMFFHRKYCAANYPNYAGKAASFSAACLTANIFFS